jgi:hypothetical protein
MPVDIRIRNRLSGGDGSPGGASKPGQIAVNFDSAAKSGNGGNPKLFASDGNAWILLNPPGVSPHVKGVMSGPDQGSVHDTFNTDSITVNAGDIIIYTWNGSAYVYTGPTGSPVAGATAAQFTSLGAAVSFATAAEIVTGTEPAKAIAPDQLRAYALVGPTSGDDSNHLVRLDGGGQIAHEFIPNATAVETLNGTLDTKFLTPADLESRIKDAPSDPSGAATGADANYLVKLNSTGHIDPAFLSFTGLTYRGSLDVTDDYAKAGLSVLKAGDFASASAQGPAHGSWPGLTGTEVVEIGDMVLYDGYAWHLVSHAIDTSAYVNRSKHNDIKNDMDMTWTPPGSLKTIIDGGDSTKSRIDRVLLDCGTF